MTPPDSKRAKNTKLRALGFCGADNSVSPRLLGVISHSYPFVEFGVLFRPDKEGGPRYASAEWVDELSKVSKSSGGTMRLAAHLCGARVNEVLGGKTDFLTNIEKLGFQRVQINATAVNGVDTSRLAESAEIFAKLASELPGLEFILQKNVETQPLWEGLLKLNSDTAGKAGCLPKNVTMLVDESKGTGVLASSWPNPPDEYDIGYAGGIGPGNVEKVLEDVLVAGQGRDIWIDMESSLRSIKGGKDVFDLDKCFDVVETVCKMGVYSHPSYIPQS
ncbi:MAG: hypothetical protein SGBAC_004018 [Bacillariaceae sp.]